MTPASQAVGSVAAAGASAIAAGMNAALHGALAGLLAALPADGKIFDFFNVFTQIFANPGAYGLTDVISTQCCSLKLVHPEPVEG